MADDVGAPRQRGPDRDQRQRGGHVPRLESYRVRPRASAFAGRHKDHPRYYELVEDTIQPDFVFRYFAIKDEDGSVRAVQPFFIIDQDLLLGTYTRLGGVIGFIRRLWPRFMKMRTLMVGCAAGEGHLDGAVQLHHASAEILAASITGLARGQGKTIVAFMSCLVEGDELCAEYIGLEYPVALDLHLYFYSFRDVVSWAIANGFKWYRSSALNYDPKFHLKHSLDPLDLYVRHTSKFINPIFRRLLPLLEPTRNDKTLPKFSNYADLWARQPRWTAG